MKIFYDLSTQRQKNHKNCLKNINYIGRNIHNQKRPKNYNRSLPQIYFSFFSTEAGKIPIFWN